MWDDYMIQSAIVRTDMMICDMVPVLIVLFVFAVLMLAILWIWLS